MATANVSGMSRGAPQQSPAEIAQDQLRALKLGLDLENYQRYKRAPKDWTNQHQKNFDPATGKFTFTGMVPGALMSNGGPVIGPNGMILAAGFTADKPIDLNSLTLVETPSEKWQREHTAGDAPSSPPAQPTSTPPTNTAESRAAGAATYQQQLKEQRAAFDATHPANFKGTQINYTGSLGEPAPAGSFGDPNATYNFPKPAGNFLPPYLQPGQSGQGQPTQANTNVLAPGAVAPVTQPVVANSAITQSNNIPGLNVSRPPLEVPYYLRGAKRKPGGIVPAYG